jgi:hypothetical protein
LGERQREDALDLGRVDRNAGDPEILTEQLLGEQASGRVVDTHVGDQVRMLTGLLDRRRLAGPAGSDRPIARTCDDALAPADGSCRLGVGSRIC